MANGYSFTTVIGIEHSGAVRLAKLTITKTEKGDKWGCEKKRVDKQQLIQAIKHGMKVLNVTVKENKLIGRTASISRFSELGLKSSYRQYLVLSELRLDNDKLIGYKLIDSSGVVMNYKLSDVLNKCNEYSKYGKVLLINGIYVAETDDRKAHIKSFPDAPFYKEVIGTKKAKPVKPEEIGIKDKKKYDANKVDKLKEIYTDEQITQLKIGRKNGVDIRIYSNPKLSAEQMRTLRCGLEMGVNVRKYAYPEFNSANMSVYNYDQANGLDINTYLNPAFSFQQLSALSTANGDGIDVKSIANPKISAYEMLERAERMRVMTWKTAYFDDHEWEELLK